MRREYSFISESPEDTKKLGMALGSVLAAGDIVLLDGALGAGKTCFTAGISETLQIEEPVVSPTYTLVNEYEDGKIPLFHYDAYRLSGGEDLYDIGFSEHLGRGIIVIEWAGNIMDAIPGDCDITEVKIERLDREGPEKRNISIVTEESRGACFADFVN